MGPKTFQDVAPPKQSESTAKVAVEPTSEPELVSDIPVRQPTGGPVADVLATPGPIDDDSSFIISDKQADKKPLADSIVNNKNKAKPKQTKPKPVAAIVIACLAALCLAAGAYLKFFNSG